MHATAIRPAAALVPILPDGTSAFADPIHSCAELWDHQSPNFNSQRDTWWRYTDARGMSCANADMLPNNVGVSVDDDDTDDPTKAKRP
jgi:hypothetical protein